MDTSRDRAPDVSMAMRRRQALKLVAGLALCPLCASGSVASESNWSYEGATGPEKWSSLDPGSAVCSAGYQQSPIDITAPVVSRQASLRINWSKKPSAIVNNGHTIQLNYSEGGTLHLGDREYGLKQLHFHHPSEHLVEGKRFAMEAHFVHAGADGLAVIGVLLVAGNTNDAFKKIVSTMPLEKGSPIAVDPAIDTSRLVPAQRAFYRYKGSLTTPPCSETVDWIVLTQPLEVDGRDIARFAELYPMNARPAQSRDRRVILLSKSR